MSWQEENASSMGLLKASLARLIALFVGVERLDALGFHASATKACSAGSASAMPERQDE